MPWESNKELFYSTTQGYVITVLPQSSILDSHLAKDETFKFQYARIKNQGSRVKDWDSRNEEFSNIKKKLESCNSSSLAFTLS